MESMDIQIVDSADLPKEPAAPNKKIIVMLGMLVGIIISVIFSLLIYKRR